MNGNMNPKVIGAGLIGFALVAGAYVITNFGEPRTQTQTANTRAAIPAPRVAIDVKDSDNNGIEDWRDEFVTTAPVILDQSTSTYEAPDTLTGEMGINFFESIIRARGYGPFGRTDEEVIDDTVDILTIETAHELYDTPDITILQEWGDQDILDYANAVAETINQNNVSGLESELVILQNLLTSEDPNRLTELKTLSEVYRRNRDDTLNISVPRFLVKEHLDLINTYHAIHKDIEGMTMALDDPAFALLRIKRYQDDATGLGYALQNMYLALEPYASLVTADDPAVLFVIFSPDFQI